MAKISVFIFLLSAIVNVGETAGSSSNWNYNDFEAWGYVDKRCVEGDRQSPIIIETQKALMDPVLFNDPLKFRNYAETFGGKLTNNGYGVVWTINATSPLSRVPHIFGSGLGPLQYVLDQFHFHWGEDDYGMVTGSEHAIDYRNGPMELHLVHHNIRYASLEDAINQPDGLAVIGILFTEVSDQESDGEYSAIAQRLPLIEKPTAHGVDFSVTLSRMIPPALFEDSVYYRYDGSLTTPPCSETVKWTVFGDRLPVRKQTLNVFRKSLQSAATSTASIQPLIANFRPYQRLGNRLVTTNSPKGIASPGFSYPDLLRSGAISSFSYFCACPNFFLFFIIAACILSTSFLHTFSQ